MTIYPPEAQREIYRLRTAVEKIQRAIIGSFALEFNGHTLFEFCELTLNPPKENAVFAPQPSRLESEITRLRLLIEKADLWMGSKHAQDYWKDNHIFQTDLVAIKNELANKKYTTGA